MRPRDHGIFSIDFFLKHFDHLYDTDKIWRIKSVHVSRKL